MIDITKMNGVSTRQSAFHNLLPWGAHNLSAHTSTDYQDLGQLGQDEPASQFTELSSGSDVIQGGARPGLVSLGTHTDG